MLVGPKGAEMTTKIEGQLEIDHDRGVIYFHITKGDMAGRTKLRISQLPTPIPSGLTNMLIGTKGAEMITKIEGQLEIDHDRGVIYFHTTEGDMAEKTKLRISQLPTPIPDNEELLDVTIDSGCSWIGYDEGTFWP